MQLWDPQLLHDTPWRLDADIPSFEAAAAATQQPHPQAPFERMQ